MPGAGAAAGKALLKNMPALANVMKSAYKTVENAGGSALKSTLEHARNLGKAHGDQLKFTLKHPVIAAVTSKTGQQTVRQSAKFIDNALRPIEVRAVQTTAGNVVTGVERGLPSGKLPAKADEYLAVKQAEKDGILGGKGIDNANRLIPGIPGKPTSGDPTKLGKNLLEKMGLPRSASWKGYQAQHVIPSQLNKHPVIKKIGMDMNDSTNGIFLPIPSEDISGLSRHRGFHSVYNNVVRKQLDKMNVNQDLAV